MTASSGLRVLCAPPMPGVYGWFTKDQVARVLQAMSEDATFVLVDMPPTLDATVAPILQAAAKILLITGDDPPAIQTTLALMQVLRSASDRILLARSGARPDRLMDTPLLEQSMRLRVHIDLPHDPNQPLALNRGAVPGPCETREPPGGGSQTHGPAPADTVATLRRRPEVIRTPAFASAERMWSGASPAKCDPASPGRAGLLRQHRGREGRQGLAAATEAAPGYRC